MKFRPELLHLVKERIEKRGKETDPKYLHGAERVDVIHVEHEKFECKVRKFRFIVDEPPERGGTDEGPNPLAYFLAGASSCLMMHYARIAIVEGLAIDDLKVTALGRFNRNIGGSFTEIMYDVRITGSESDGRIIQLAKRAQGLCYAHNTLNKAVRVITNLYLNDRKIWKSS